MSDLQILELGDILLQSGEVLSDAKLAYSTVGTLNEARDNVIIMPTYYGGQHANYAPLVGVGKSIDPTRFFVVIPNMFGNGVSSSPSNHPAGVTGEFPLVTLYDNVLQQARLVFDYLQVRQVELVCGWSMGGMQAYEWAVLYPRQVRKVLPFCATARTSTYNNVFLRGLKASLLADCNWDGRRFRNPPRRGVSAFVSVYIGWAYSERFFSEHLYRVLGFDSVEALVKSWEVEHEAVSAEDLLAMLATWQAADVSNNSTYHGDLPQALANIKARTLLIPCRSDRYFSVEDNRLEARYIPLSEVRVLESPFGHCALSPGKLAEPMKFLEQALAELLAAE